MILGIFLLSLFTLVCSQHKIPYVESIEAIDDLTKQLEEQVISMEDGVPDITDARRHYAILVTHIVRVADRLSSGALYPIIFIEELPGSVALALLDADTVVDTTQEILEKVDNHTQKLQSLIDALCTDTEPTVVCNQIVDQAVRGDPERYNDEAELMILGGKLAGAMLAADLVSVAHDYDEMAYLIVNMENLKPMIFGIANIIDGVDE